MMLSHRTVLSAVTLWLAALNVNPLLLGVTVYDPFANPVKLYPPEPFAVVVAEDVPLNVTVAPFPPLPLIVPEIVNVCGTAVDATAPNVTFAPLTVAFILVGLNVKPLLLARTV